MRSVKDRFRPLLRLEAARNAPLMIQGVRHAWELHLREDDEPRWFERFLTPHFRSAFQGIAGCEAYAGLSARAVPAASRSGEWRRLLEHLKLYPRFELRRKVSFLRALGALSLYHDAAALAAADAPIRPGPLTRAQAEYRLIVERVRFLLHEPSMRRDESLAFLDIARRSPRGATIRLESAIFFLSRALEKGLPRSDIGSGLEIASSELALLRAVLPAWEHARWESKYWRCVSYDAYLRGDPREARRQLVLAEKAARVCVAKTPKGVPAFGVEDLYGVLTTMALTEAKLGFPERSRGVLEELIAMDPEGSWQRLEMGRLLMSEDKPEEAYDAFSTAVRLGPPRGAEACARLAKCCERLGRAEEAGEWARRSSAVKLNEESFSSALPTRSRARRRL